MPLSEIIGIDCTGLSHAFKLDGVNLTIAVKRKNLALTKDVMLNCLGAAGKPDDSGKIAGAVLWIRQH
ncbi:MAG: hypothetical protein IKA80_09915 [Spirochaetaceae bacterium]|nr:hypothetical protein [Spirochaetaceae bacterium]